MVIIFYHYGGHNKWLTFCMRHFNPIVLIDIVIIIIIFIRTYSTRKEHKKGNVHVQRLCRESIKEFQESHYVIQLRHKWSMISPMSGVSSSTKSCPSRTIHSYWIKAALCPNSSSPRQSHFTASSKLLRKLWSAASQSIFMLLLVTDPGVYAAAVNTYLTMSFLLPRALL